MRVALVVPYFDALDETSPRDLLLRQHTLRGLVEGLAGRGIQARGFQLHATRTAVPVAGGRIDFVPGPRGSARIAGVLHRRAPRHGPAYYIPAVPLFRLAARWQPDVMHVLGLDLHPNLVLARLTASNCGAALVVSFHGGAPTRPGPTRWLSRYALRGARRVTFTSAEQAHPWIDRGLLSDGQVAIAMETSTLMVPRRRELARARLGISGDPLCVSVARMEPVKDPLTTLAGFALVAEGLPRAHLHWFGPVGSLGAFLRAISCAVPGLADRMTFHGYVPPDSMADVMSAADYLIQSSVREWSGLAVMEAMACGAVPVVTDIPAMRRMTDGGRAGRLFPAGDPAGLARQLLEVEAGGRAVEETAVKERFAAALSFAALAESLEATYREALRAVPGSATPSAA